MLYRFSNKGKVIILMAGYVFLLIVIYQVAIKSTVTARKECRKLHSKILLVENAPIQIANLEKKIDDQDVLLSSVAQSEAERHDFLLSSVSKYCQDNRLVLKRFPETHMFIKQNYSIYSDIITVEGGFISLLKLLYMVETDKRFGKISSVAFNSFLDRKNRQYKLNMTFYVQNIQHITEENTD